MLRELPLAKRIAALRQSEIRNMTIECARAGGINLSQGVCDTDLPEIVRRAAQRAMDQGVNIYTRYDGLTELRLAIASKLRAYNRLEYDSETEIVVTSGATGAFAATCFALLEEGCEVIVFEPYYGYHVDTLTALAAIPRFVQLSAPSFSFSEAELRRAITPRTRAVLVNTPGNPSGKVFSREELELIGRVAREHDLLIITDEIYEYFLYDARKHLSIASLPDLRERTITIGGYSKTFSITGWRIGYLAAPAPVAQKIGHVHDLIYVCAPAPLQLGVAHGIAELEVGFYEALQAQYAQKRDKLCEALERAGLNPHVPQGAYYVLADVTRVPGNSSKQRALTILERAGVASVPATAFFSGETGQTMVRFSYAKKMAELDEACRRLTSVRF